MKKITLVLCACAMAFTGLLVSCSNNSGTEEIIFRDKETNCYVYEVSGIEVITKNEGGLDTTVTTTTDTVEFSGVGTLTWTLNDDELNDFQNYSLEVKTGQGYGTRSIKYSGEEGKNKTAPKDIHDDYGYFYYNTNSANEIKLDFHYAAGNYYLTKGSTASTVVYTEEGEKALENTIKITGDIAESDTLTIVVSYVIKNNDNETAKTVDNSSEVYTLKLVKAGSAE